MFVQAGFNHRHRSTGIRAWTRNVNGNKGGFKPAELIRFESGEYAWAGKRFLVWGEQCVFASWEEFDLPQEWQIGLPQSPLPVPKARAREVVKLVLPYPVSANRYWISFYAHKARRVFTGPTKEAEAYKQECGWRAKAAGIRTPIEGLVELRVRLVPKNKVCMDLDNCLKVSVDALKGIVYADDDQIYRIVAERSDADPIAGPRLEVEVLPYVLPMALEAAA